MSAPHSRNVPASDLLATREDAELLAALNAVGNAAANGSGQLGTTDWWWAARGTMEWTADDAPLGHPASFLAAKQSAGETTHIESSVIYPAADAPVAIGMSLKNAVPDSKTGGYLGASPYDAFGRPILPHHYAYRPNATTTLAKPLAVGDTEIHLTDSTGWRGRPDNPAGNAPHFRSLIAWNYVDAGGREWPPFTYSRNSELSMWEDGSINPDTHVITLNKPWNMMAADAGTVVSNATSGSTYMYLQGGGPFRNLPEEWTRFGDEVQGFQPVGTPESGMPPATFGSGFPVGAAGYRVLMLLNHPGESTGTDVKTLVSAITVSRLEALDRRVGLAGPTSQRPTSRRTAGMQYFDTTIGRPIWYAGSGNWVDATGTTV